MLKTEFTVLEGEYAKRKVFGNCIVSGTTEGQKEMAEHYLGMLKGILASARYVDPNDRSPETLAKYRRVARLRRPALSRRDRNRDGQGRLRGQEHHRCARSRATCPSGATVRRSNRSDRQRAAPQGRRNAAKRVADSADREAAVGVVTCAELGVAAISADRDNWTKQAFDAGIVAAKDLIGTDGPIRPTVVPIGRLTESEWGWIVSTAVSTWVRVRSRAGGARRLELRARHPRDRARARSVARGRGRVDPAQTRRGVPWSRLGKAGRRMGEERRRRPSHRRVRPDPACARRARRRGESSRRRPALTPT